MSPSQRAATKKNADFFCSSVSETYFEVDLVNKLQGVIEKQRSQIKKLDQAILDYKAENEEVLILISLSINED